MAGGTLDIPMKYTHLLLSRVFCPSVLLGKKEEGECVSITCMEGFRRSRNWRYRMSVHWVHRRLYHLVVVDMLTFDARTW
jgi:hypothetical protein